MWQRLKRKLAVLSHPAIFHGPTGRRAFFEGWYYRLADEHARHMVAVIPGVCYAADPAQSHAFVQIFDATTGRRIYARYPLESFRASTNEHALHVGPNFFTDRELRLDIQCGDDTVRGTIKLGTPSPWPVSSLYPGYMGWLALLPLTRCYHAVLSMGHSTTGTLTLNGQKISFDGGRGYTEKDWGERFPSKYIWLQCQHLDALQTSLVVSIARVPWAGTSFPGFVIGLRHPGGFQRFATYTGACLRIAEADPTRIHLIAQKRQSRLEIKAHRPPPRGDRLLVPDGKTMTPGPLQTMDATVEVLLQSGHGQTRRTMFRATGHHGCLEVHGFTKEGI